MTELLVYWLFVVASTLFFIATIPLIAKIIKNRNILSDYSSIGSTITFVGVFLTVIAFWVMRNYASVLLSLTTLVLWLFASIYSTKFVMSHMDRRERQIKDNVYMGRGTNNAMVRRTYNYARPLRFGMGNNNNGPLCEDENWKEES